MAIALHHLRLLGKFEFGMRRGSDRRRWGGWGELAFVSGLAPGGAVEVHDVLAVISCHTGPSDAHIVVIVVVVHPSILVIEGEMELALARMRVRDRCLYLMGGGR